MALISWTDKFSVSVGEIDRQHGTLIDMVNELHDAMRQMKSKEVIEPILDRLTNYTLTHFSTEEKYMTKFNYAGYDAHKAEHESFVAKVSEFRKDYENGRITLTMTLMNFLKDWLVKHIQGTDMKYRECFNENGLK